MTAATNCPSVIISWLIALTFPRKFAGAHSDKYTGMVIDAIPNPAPTTARPAKSDAYPRAAPRIADRTRVLKIAYPV